MSGERCWCGRPAHNDLLDGCVGDGLLRMLFGPPSVNTMISNMIVSYGDLTLAAFEGDQAAIDFIAANPIPGPSIESDRAILRSAGMDVSSDDIQSLRAWYSPTSETH